MFDEFGEYNNYVCLKWRAFFLRFDCCSVMISDQGREFLNNVKVEVFALTGTKHHVTSAYHPQSNGLTERFNQTLQTALVKLVNANQNDWEDHLSALCVSDSTAEGNKTNTF